MSTTTAIQLTEAPAAHLEGDSRPFARVTAAGSQRRAKSPDAVLEASRAVDSSAPEGGYGWVVIGAGAVLLWWSLGITYAWGVMQSALVDSKLANSAVLSFIGSLQAALMSALAVFNTRLMRTIGTRYTALLGASLMGLSGIISSFAVNSVGGLFFTSGVLMGIGVSLCFVVVAAVPSQYFSKRRGFANGIMFAGSGFGGAANSFILDALIEKIGIPWAYRVIGLATLATGLPAAWLIKERVPLSQSGFVECALGTFPLFVPPFFISLYTKSLGFSSNVGAGLVAGFSLASAFGRIGSGIMCDKFGSLNTVFISMMLTAITMLAVWPQSTTLAPLIVFVIVNGASNGAFFSTMPTAVSNVFGSARVAVAMSMVVTGWIGGYLMGAPIAGYLLEAYGGTEKGLQAFRPAMFYAGSLALVAGALIIAARFRMNKALLGRM